MDLNPVSDGTVLSAGETDCLKYLRVCLCDISAEDMVAHLLGLPVRLCGGHYDEAKTVKLQSLMELHCSLLFDNVDDDNFEPVTIFEAVEKLKERWLKNPT